MLGRTAGAVLVGVDARLVEVEVHLGGGLPAIAAVGLPNSSVREGIDRILQANMGALIVVGDGPERDCLMRRFPSARFVGHVERPLALSYVAAADVPKYDLVAVNEANGARRALLSDPAIVRATGGDCSGAL